MACRISERAFVTEGERESYKNHAGQARLHLLQGDAILHAHNLLLHGDGVLETLQSDVRESGNHGKAIVGGVGDERVEHLVSGRAQLVVRILSAGKEEKGLVDPIR